MSTNDQQVKECGDNVGFRIPLFEALTCLILVFKFKLSFDNLLLNIILSSG